MENFGIPCIVEMVVSKARCAEEFCTTVRCPCRFVGPTNQRTLFISSPVRRISMFVNAFKVMTRGHDWMSLIERVDLHMEMCRL